MLVLALVSAAQASAAPGAPNVQVVQSANGHWLVVTHFEFDSPDTTAIRHVLRTTYEVLEREPFRNEKDHLSTNLPFWSQSAMAWHVDFEGFAGFWPLISDDGKSLVLVRIGLGIPQTNVLRVYEKQVFEGRMVRSVSLADLWPASQVEAMQSQTFTDHSYQWFVGSSFQFGPDGDFTYRSKWGERLHIRLSDGVITTER